MTVEEHPSAEELERLFREEKSARMAKRIWIVWQARLGRTEPEITAEISLARRTVQQCVRGYNTAVLAGLQDRVGRGRKPPLSSTEETLFRQRIEAEPQLSDEVCSWRGVDCQRFLETQFGQQKSLSAVSWLLHRLGSETPAQEVRPPRSGHFQKQVPDQIAEIAAQHPDKKIVVVFQDECRFGQQGTLTRKWAKRGSRPTAVRQTEYNDLWVIAAASPQTGQAEAILSPVLNTGIINQFLDQFSRSLADDVQAVMIWDGTGFHAAHDLRVPANVTLIQLPPYSPELNGIENLWHYLHSHFWSNRTYADDDDLFEVAESTWCKNCLNPELIKSVCAKNYIQTRSELLGSVLVNAPATSTPSSPLRALSDNSCLCGVPSDADTLIVFVSLGI